MVFKDEDAAPDGFHYTGTNKEEHQFQHLYKFKARIVCGGCTGSLGNVLNKVPGKISI
jgi:hypothetical protein